MIEIKQLTVRYPDSKTPVLDALSLHVAPGTRMALIGANGAGKSTLLSALLGLLRPDGGSITVDRIALTEKTADAVRQRVGMVFQNPDDQLFCPTAADDIAFGLRERGMGHEQVHQRVHAIAERLGISQLLSRAPHRLSGGEKRMVGLAGILVLEPSVLLMDEPSSFLDPRARRRLMEQMNALSMTQLIATHDLDLALDLCDTAAILDHGKLAACGPAQELLRDRALLERCGLELPFRLQGT